MVHKAWIGAIVVAVAAAVVFFLVPGMAVIAVIVGIVALIWAAMAIVGAGRSDTELEHDEYLDRHPEDAKYMHYDA